MRYLYEVEILLVLVGEVFCVGLCFLVGGMCSCFLFLAIVKLGFLVGHGLVLVRGENIFLGAC